MQRAFRDQDFRDAGPGSIIDFPSCRGKGLNRNFSVFHPSGLGKMDPGSRCAHPEPKTRANQEESINYTSQLHAVSTGIYAPQRNRSLALVSLTRKRRAQPFSRCDVPACMIMFATKTRGKRLFPGWTRQISAFFAISRFFMTTLRILFLFIFLLPCLRAEEPATGTAMVGAWRINGAPERVMIITPHYWAQTIFDRDKGEFVRTLGGSSRTHGDLAEGRIDFDSQAPDSVGQQFQVRVHVSGDRLTVHQEDGNEETWIRIDRGDKALTGTWRISGRLADGEIKDMPLGPRRTLKILSGTRFQWIAMNTETGEFFGTGGGTYSYQDGKYIEQIEFFSRDKSRVGAKLDFEAEVKDDTWHHRGRTSRGEPLHEIWTRFDPLAAR